MTGQANDGGTTQTNTDGGDPKVEETLLTKPVEDSKPVEGEKKPVEGEKKPAEGEKKPVEGEKKPVEDKAPESYEPFTLPNGMELDPEMGKTFSALAKEHNLGQEQAQKFMDLAAQHTELLIAKQLQDHNAQREAWVKEIKKDVDFGGNLFNDTLTRAQRTLAKFGTPALIELLNQSGYGDSPEVVKMLARVDKALAEDTTVEGDPTTPEGKSTADTIYPDK